MRGHCSRLARDARLGADQRQHIICTNNCTLTQYVHTFYAILFLNRRPSERSVEVFPNEGSHLGQPLALASLAPPPSTLAQHASRGCSPCARCARTSPSQRRPSFARAPRLISLAGHSHPAHLLPDLRPGGRCSACSLTALNRPVSHPRADVHRDCAPFRPASMGRSALLRKHVDAQNLCTPLHQHVTRKRPTNWLGQRFSGLPFLKTRGGQSGVGARSPFRAQGYTGGGW